MSSPRRFRLPGDLRALEVWWDPRQRRYVIVICASRFDGDVRVETCESLSRLVMRLESYSEISSDRLLTDLWTTRRVTAELR